MSSSLTCWLLTTPILEVLRRPPGIRTPSEEKAASSGLYVFWGQGGEQGQGRNFKCRTPQIVSGRFQSSHGLSKAPHPSPAAGSCRGLTCARCLGTLPRGSVVAALTGTEGGSLRLGRAVLGALETMGRVHVRPVGAAWAGCRGSTVLWSLGVFMGKITPSPSPHPCIGNTPPR